MKNISILIVLCLLTSNAVLLAQNKNDAIKVWFDTQLTEQGAPVWRDKIGATLHTGTVNTSHQPQKADILNFNPCFYFDGSKDGIDISMGQQDLSQSTFFIVYQAADSTTERIVWHYEKDGVSKIRLSTHVMAQFAPNEYINFLDQAKDVAQINAFASYQEKDEATPLSQTIYIGHSPSSANLPGSNFKGKIAEILVFDRLLDYAEFLQIESYLALKYGISLQHSYYNSKGEIIWDLQKHSSYSSNITGIGRDDEAVLYQKQATNSYKPNLLTIGIEQIADKNEKNTANMVDNSFLIWGDNNQDLYFEEKETTVYKPLNRKWLMSSFGQKSTLQTILKFDTKQIRSVVPRDEPYFLMIDRSGKSNFNDSNAEIIKADSLDENGFAFFKNLHWDTDGSGSDVFSIATAAKIADIVDEQGNFKSLVLYPNPTTDGSFTLRADLLKAGDLEIQIHDVFGKLILSKILRGGDFYIFNEKLHAKGIFLITVTSDKTTQTLKIIAE